MAKRKAAEHRGRSGRKAQPAKGAGKSPAKPARGKPAKTSSPAKSSSAKPGRGKPTARSSRPVGQDKGAASSKSAAPKQSTGKAVPAKAASVKAPAKPVVRGPMTQPESVPVSSLGSARKNGRAAPVEKHDDIDSAPLRKTNLTDQELAEFRELLLEKRRELVGDMNNMTDEARRAGAPGGTASSMPIHMADLGSDTWEQELTLGLIENERALLREIDDALLRISNKTYGICIATNKPIGKARLRFKPWAKYCIEHARKMELGRG